MSLCTKSAGSFFTRRAGLIAQKKIKVMGSMTSMRKSISPAPEVPLHGYARGSIVHSQEALSPGGGEDQPPLTRIVGKSTGKVLWVHADKLSFFLENVASKESRDIVNSISRTSIGMQLSQVPFVEQAAMLPADLRALGEVCSYAHFPVGKVIFSQGDTAENFYIILKGAVDITIDVKALRGSGEEQVKATTRRVGDSFGVAALIYNAAERKYSATASQRTLCLLISKANFLKFLNQAPALENALMLSTKRFLLQRYAAMNVPIFSHMSEQLLDQASNLATFKHLSVGEVVYRQGDPPKAFYVVLHGSVEMKTVRKAQASSRDGPQTSSREDGPQTSSREYLDGSFKKESRGLAESMISVTADGTSSEHTLTVGQHFGGP